MNTDFSREVWVRYQANSASAIKASLKRVLIEADEVQSQDALTYVGGWLSNLPKGRRNEDIHLAILSCMASGLTHNPEVFFGEACKNAHMSEKDFDRLISKGDLYDFLLTLRRSVQQHKHISCNLDNLVGTIRSRFLYGSETAMESWLRKFYI